jgi:hypothetical protein
MIRSIDIERINLRHAFGTDELASKFLKDTNISQLIFEAYGNRTNFGNYRTQITTSTDLITGKSFPSLEIEVEMGRKIGTNKNYNGDYSILRMLMDYDGRIFSAYPVFQFEVPPALN